MAEGRLVVDGRWHGRHGIARFAAEVTSRLVTPSTSLSGPRDPLSPLDVVNPARLRLSRTDLVFTPGFNAGLSRARQLLTLHDLIHLDTPEEQALGKRLYYERVVRPAVRRAGTVLTVSAASRVAVEHWLDGDARVVDVGNGCADVFFDPPRNERTDGHLLYVGNLKPHKNPGVVFAALARNRDLRLVVVTDDRAEAERLAGANGVRDRVEVRSGLDDAALRDEYASAAALVLPSLLEGFGLPAVESLAVGRPVIFWSGCSSVATIVGDAGTAIEDAADAAAWSEAMAAAAGAGRSLSTPAGWATRWSWAAVAHRVDGEISALLQRPAGSSSRPPAH